MGQTLAFLSLFEKLTPDPEKNIPLIVSFAAKSIGTPCSMYSRLDERKKLFYACSTIGLHKSTSLNGNPKGRVCFEKTLQSGNSPVVITDLLRTPYIDTDPVIKKYQFRSYLGCSVPVQGKALGSLCVMDLRPRKFSSEQLDLIAALSKALSLEEERLHIKKAFEVRLECEKMLTDISSFATCINGERSFIDKCISRIRKTIDVEGMFFWKYDPKTDTVGLVTGRTIKKDKPNVKEYQGIPASYFPWGMSLVSKNDIIQIEDVETIPDGKEKEIMRSMDIKSILMIPLFTANGIYGVLGFESYCYHKKWLEQDIYILKTVSQIITRAIEQHHAEKAIEEAKKTLEKKVKQRTSELSRALTELQKKQKQLLRYKSKLEEMNKVLIQTNTALKVLAKNVEESRKQGEKRLAHLLTTQIMPVLNRLRKAKMPNTQRKELDILFGHLKELGKALEEGKGAPCMLSASETRVASLIKNGFTTRQVARQLNLSEETVKTHRRNIRKKLNINNTQVSLATYLRSKWES